VFNHAINQDFTFVNGKIIVNGVDVTNNYLVNSNINNNNIPTNSQQQNIQHPVQQPVPINNNNGSHSEAIVIDQPHPEVHPLVTNLQNNQQNAKIEELKDQIQELN